MMKKSTLSKSISFLFATIVLMATSYAQDVSNDSKAAPALTGKVRSIQGSWGVTFPVFGGERLDLEVGRGFNHRAGAQEIVDELPDAGHVITNLSYFAHSHYFTLRGNTNVDIAREIHPSLVPTSENGRIILDVIRTFKRGGKTVILYISTNHLDRASDEVQAAWRNYYNKNFGGNEYKAYENLIQGFVERFKNEVDGYWLDTTTNLRRDGNYDDFVAMIRRTDTDAFLTGGGKTYFKDDKGKNILVDSDGVRDTNTVDYPVIRHVPKSTTHEDYTNGHVTPLGQGAPPNSFAYEEFTIPDMVREPVVEFRGRPVLKHAWFPIRERWHSPQVNLVFDTEQAYRFAKTITDGNASMTFANTIDPRTRNRQGFMMQDEMAIMKTINDRMRRARVPNPTPYSRPRGASYVGGDPRPKPTPTPTQNDNLVHLVKRNAKGFAIDGGRGGANRQNIYLQSSNSSNVNQQWNEIDRGNGYYSYQKANTDFCIDGNRGGANGQNVYLWECSNNNQNQHWRKVSMGGGSFRLEKRNAPGFSLDGGNKGANGQNLYLWKSSDTNQNQHWTFGEANKTNDLTLPENGFIAYPVPFSDILNIQLDSSELETTVEILNSKGQVMASTVISNGIDTIDLSNLSSGVYIIKAINTEMVQEIMVTKN